MTRKHEREAREDQAREDQAAEDQAAEDQAAERGLAPPLAEILAVAFTAPHDGSPVVFAQGEVTHLTLGRSAAPHPDPDKAARGEVIADQPAVIVHAGAAGVAVAESFADVVKALGWAFAAPAD